MVFEIWESIVFNQLFSIRNYSHELIFIPCLRYLTLINWIGRSIDYLVLWSSMKFDFLFNISDNLILGPFVRNRSRWNQWIWNPIDFFEVLNWRVQIGKCFGLCNTRSGREYCMVYSQFRNLFNVSWVFWVGEGEVQRPKTSTMTMGPCENILTVHRLVYGTGYWWVSLCGRTCRRIQSCRIGRRSVSCDNPRRRPSSGSRASAGSPRVCPPQIPRHHTLARITCHYHYRYKRISHSHTISHLHIPGCSSPSL